MTAATNRVVDVEIGAFLAQQRRSRGISQSTVATQLGLKQSVISKAESGKRRVTVAEFLIWANALGVTFDECCAVQERLWASHVATTSIWTRGDPE